MTRYPEDHPVTQMRLKHAEFINNAIEETSRELRGEPTAILYTRWRVTAMINGKRFWATVTADTGTEGEAKKMANKLFSFPLYSDRVQVSPVRSSLIVSGASHE